MRPNLPRLPWRSAVLGVVLACGTPALPALAAAAPVPVDVLAVTASSTDGMLMDAVDGDPTTAWQNKREGEKDAWIAVRFAQVSKIKAVRLHLEALGPDVSVDVETSVDGESYHAQLKGHHATKDAMTELKLKKPAQALYVRVRFTYTGAKTAPRFRLKELEALGG
jgi:hypothetical protein